MVEVTIIKEITGFIDQIHSKYMQAHRGNGCIKNQEFQKGKDIVLVYLKNSELYKNLKVFFQ